MVYKMSRVTGNQFYQEARTVSLLSAMEQSLLSRAGRSRRTLAELRQCCFRMLRERPELAEMPVRHITPELCRELITSVFPTSAMQRKVRCLLYGIFSFSERRGWCCGNPLVAIDIPTTQESSVELLPLPQLRRLLAAARLPEHRACAPALGLMLWGGVRPAELVRLRWLDVHVEEGVINIDARLAQAGCARQVTLYPVLRNWLRAMAPYRLPGAAVVPRAWARRWRALRLAAGVREWNPEALRHTFAAFHLKHFGDEKLLQSDMGNMDMRLLHRNYRGIEDIDARAAAEFWGESYSAGGSTGSLSQAG